MRIRGRLKTVVHHAFSPLLSPAIRPASGAYPLRQSIREWIARVLEMMKVVGREGFEPAQKHVKAATTPVPRPRLTPAMRQ